MSEQEQSPLGMIKVLAAGVMFIATISCSLLGWLALSVNELNSSFASMRTELDIISPMNLLTELHAIKSTQLEPKGVERIMRGVYPSLSDWHRESPQWMVWRIEVGNRLKVIKEIVVAED